MVFMRFQPKCTSERIVERIVKCSSSRRIEQLVHRNLKPVCPCLPHFGSVRLYLYKNTPAVIP